LNSSKVYSTFGTAGRGQPDRLFVRPGCDRLFVPTNRRQAPRAAQGKVGPEGRREVVALP
jgi:hypothetical protein